VSRILTVVEARDWLFNAYRDTREMFDSHEALRVERDRAIAQRDNWKKEHDGACELSARKSAMIEDALGLDARTHPEEGWLFEEYQADIRAIRAERDTLRAERDAAIERVRIADNVVCWGVACVHQAAALDRAIDLTERAEKAEAERIDIHERLRLAERHIERLGEYLGEANDGQDEAEEICNAAMSVGLAECGALRAERDELRGKQSLHVGKTAEEWATIADERGFARDRAVRERDALAKQLDMYRPDEPCKCGSGIYPRKCRRHPWEYDLHIASINYEGVVEERDELEAERDILQGILKQRASRSTTFEKLYDGAAKDLDAARQASAAAFADLATAASAAVMHDDEYPLKAILRAIAERDDLRARLAKVVESGEELMKWPSGSVLYVQAKGRLADAINAAKEDK